MCSFLACLQGSDIMLADLATEVENTKTRLKDAYEGEERYTGAMWKDLDLLLNANELLVGLWELDKESDTNYHYLHHQSDIDVYVPLTCTKHSGRPGRPVIMNASPGLLASCAQRQKTAFTGISKSTRVDLGKHLSINHVPSRDGNLCLSCNNALLTLPLQHIECSIAC